MHNVVAININMYLGILSVRFMRGTRTKTRLFKYIENFTKKTDSFQI